MKVRHYLILAVSLLLLGCSNIETLTDGYGYVSGDVSEAYRAAVPSEAGENVAYVIVAEDSSGNKKYSVSRVTSYNLTLPQEVYSFYAKAIRLENLDDFNIYIISNYDILFSSETRSSVTVTAGKQLTMETFVLRPVRNAGKNGTVKLSIKTKVSSIKKVNAEWYSNNPDNTTNCTLEFPEGSDSVTFTLNADGTEAPVTSGVYYATFSFYDENENLLYKTAEEAINVFDNLETNTWLKLNAPYLNKGVFEITQSCLDSFKHGTDYYVSSTGNNSNTGTWFDPVATVQKAVELINKANDGTSEYKIIVDGTISESNTTANVTYGSNYISIIPDKKLSLTIEGSNNATLKGSGSYRIMFASGGANSLKLTLRNITLHEKQINTSKLSNNESLRGGGIFVENNCTLNLENCTMTLENGTDGNILQGAGIYLKENVIGSSINIKDSKISGIHLSPDVGGNIKISGKTRFSSLLVTGDDTNSYLTFDNTFVPEVSGDKLNSNVIFEAYDASNNYYVPEDRNFYKNGTSNSLADYFSFKKHENDTSSDNWKIVEVNKYGVLKIANSNGGQLGDVTVHSLRGELLNTASGEGLTIDSVSGGTYTYKVYDGTEDITAAVKDFNIEFYCDGVLLNKDSQIDCTLMQESSKITIKSKAGFTLEADTTLTVYFTFSYLGVSGYSDSFNLAVK